MSLSTDDLHAGDVGVVVLRTRQIIQYGEAACVEALAAALAPLGLRVREYLGVKPDPEAVAENIARFADHYRFPLVFTVGGTGFHREDVAPEGTMLVIHRPVPGIAEAIRAQLGAARPEFLLSRAQAGLRGRTLVINLPEAPNDIAAAVHITAPVLRAALARLQEHRTEAQIRLL